jgi:isocitrate dehydrogenase (NAD+)
MTTYQGTLIRGDGIGPEITAETIKALTAAGVSFDWDDELAGVAAVDATGTPLPDATIESIRRTRLALKGPLTTPVGTGFRSVNVGLRREFELYANVRPAKTIIPGGRYENVDIVMVRENLEGLYVGYEHFIPIGDDPRAVGESIAVVTRVGCERVIRYAFEYALTHGRKKVTIVHKANILKMVSGLFLEVGKQVATEYAGRVASNDMIVDNTAMQLVMRPEQFDVMVTTNMFGDILSDEASELSGSLGLGGSINAGDSVCMAQAQHGSAPDIAGRGIANPASLILSAALLLDWRGRRDKNERLVAAGRAIEAAVDKALAEPASRTADLGGSAGTDGFAAAVCAAVERG